MSSVYMPFQVRSSCSFMSTVVTIVVHHYLFNCFSIYRVTTLQVSIKTSFLDKQFTTDATRIIFRLLDFFVMFKNIKKLSSIDIGHKSRKNEPERATRCVISAILEEA